MARMFTDRYDAGRALAETVAAIGIDRPIVLGLPRGGVPVAFEVAQALGAPLDTITVRKLGAPQQPELAIGAIASGDVRVLNEQIIEALGIDDDTIDRIAAAQAKELRRREKQYRGDRPFPSLAEHDVILVDDGLATGATMRAAVEAVRIQAPASIVVALPTASKSSLRVIAELVDRVICIESPPDFHAVGQFYVDFSQTTDDEVRELLDKQDAQVQTP